VGEGLSELADLHLERGQDLGRFVRLDLLVGVGFKQVVGEHAFGVNIAFNDGWPDVLVDHDNEEVFQVSQVVEDLSLKQKKIRVDLAFLKS
jgi:hypothetical protein